MSYQKGVPVVIDNGSGKCKVGFAGDDVPISAFSSVVGRPRFLGMGMGKDSYIGNQAQAKEGVLKLSHPIEHGIVNNWDDMEIIWHDCFYNKLRVTPSEHPTLLTQAPRNPKVNREKMAQVMFQSFKVPKLYIENPALLSVYPSGISTALMVDVGDGLTTTTPMVEYQPISYPIQRYDLGGRDLTEYLFYMLKTSAHYSSTRQQVRDLKEKVCYVALDYQKQIESYKFSKSSNLIYQLLNGTCLSVKSERIICPEALFNPMLIGKQMPGLHQTVYKSIIGCKKEYQSELYKNIILTGGSTLFPGLLERLQKQLKLLAPPNTLVRVRGQAQRKFLPWIGGSILAASSSFQKWITRAEYQEVGARIVHRNSI